MKASDFSVERASAKHLYSITVMTKQYFPYAGLSMNDVAERMRSKNFSYFVALYGGHSVGFVDLQLKGRTCKILGLAVLPEFRGNGVGTKLLKRAIAEARKKKAKKLVLLTTEENTARRLYERLGFKKKGRLAKKLWGQQVIVMTRAA